MIWFVFCGDALGLGCDDRKVIEILAHRNYVQRQELRREYKIRYGDDLIDKLKSELHAKFEVRIWVKHPSILPEMFCMFTTIPPPTFSNKQNYPSNLFSYLICFNNFAPNSNDKFYN